MVFFYGISSVSVDSVDRSITISDCVVGVIVFVISALNLRGMLYSISQSLLSSETTNHKENVRPCSLRDNLSHTLSSSYVVDSHVVLISWDDG